MSLYGAEAKLYMVITVAVAAVIGMIVNCERLTTRYEADCVMESTTATQMIACQHINVR